MEENITNLLNLYNSCDDNTVKLGITWYDKAKLEALRLSRDYFLPSVCTHAAGIIAVLSPSVQWERNLIDAENVCSTRRGDPVRVSTYGQFLAKALAIRDGDSPQKWISPKTAPKTYSFWMCIRNPKNTEHVVIDRHALAACVGRNLTDKERGGMLKRVGGYSTYAQVYRDAAKEVGILPLQMQATCWLKWRNDHA